MSKALSGPRCVLVFAILALLGGCAGALNLPASGRHQSYTVKRGDTLYAIAWHYGLDYRTVARWNGISYPYTIHPGERIYLYPHRGASHAARRPQRRKKLAAAKTIPLKEGSGGKTSSVAPAPRTSDLNWRWPAKGAVHATS